VVLLCGVPPTEISDLKSEFRLSLPRFAIQCNP